MFLAVKSVEVSEAQIVNGASAGVGTGFIVVVISTLAVQEVAVKTT